MALSDNVSRDSKSPRILTLKVKTAVRIYQGALVCVDGATGYAVPAANTSGYMFKGIARDEANNTSGADGAITVDVDRTARFVATLASAAITDIGLEVYVSDDNTVTKTVGNGVKVGKVVALVGTNLVEIDPIGAYAQAPAGAHIADPAAMDAITGSTPAACDAMTQGAYTASTTLTDPPTKAEMEAELALIDAATDQTIVDTTALKTAIDANNVAIDANIVDILAAKTAIDALNATVDSILARLEAVGISRTS